MRLLELVVTSSLLELPARAYVGPGIGLGILGTLLGILLSIVFSIYAGLWYPLKRLIRWFRKTPDPSSRNDRGEAGG